jgi:hypothetical protein
VERNTAGAVVAVEARMNYQAEAVQLVKSMRDADGNDVGLVGAEWAPIDVRMHNARLAAERPAVHTHGFEVLETGDPAAERGIDFKDTADCTDRYYAECEAVIKKALGGGCFVKAFDHNVRSSTGFAAKEALKGGGQVQQPASLVHGDYTANSAPRRLELLGQPPKLNDALRPRLGDQPLLSAGDVNGVLDGGGRRFMLINVWRNILPDPVESMPLACCDARGVKAEDLLTFEIHYADRIGENYFARHRKRHDWYYFPDMARNEALLIKQWDSAGGLARGHASDASNGAPSTFALHSAFQDPSAPPDARTRESIEVRCVVVFDEEKAE